jgi:hypothetical protein
MTESTRKSLVLYKMGVEVLIGFRYHCEQLDIYQCSILGSCSLYENCKTWCIDLTAPGGAKCADAMPNAIAARGAAGIVWDNDATGKYM